MAILDLTATQDLSNTVITLLAKAHSSRAEILNQSEILTYSCCDFQNLCDLLRMKTCGAVLLSEEFLTSTVNSEFKEILELQSSWSDLPVLVLTEFAEPSKETFKFAQTKNVTFLQENTPPSVTIHFLKQSLRERKKQYEVRELFLALVSAKDQAEVKHHSQLQFLANMSQEVRTPVGTILGYTSLLKNPQNSEEENRDYLKVVERNSLSLLRMIDDILDLAKLDSGDLIVEKKPLALSEMLSDFITLMSFRASEKGVIFRYQADSALPDKVLLDVNRLKQILYHVVGNAIKFTEKGSVDFHIAYIPSASILRFLIKDTGIGISTGQSFQIFQAFSHCESPGAPRYGGTGLGLVLSKRLAEVLGGRVELIESSPLSGSTFLIEIQAPQP